MMRMGPGGAGAELIHADGPVKAMEIQEELRQRRTIKKTTDTGKIRHVAGADAAYAGDRIHAAVTVLTFPGLEVVEKTCTVGRAPFPYIPGLLSFREGPAILDAFSHLTAIPGLIVLNGHGIAHPRRFGIACHVGFILGIPSVGIARRLLTGTAAVPGTGRGCTAAVFDGDEVIGMAVRTVEDKKPVFVSAGYGVDLGQAVEMALKTTTGHRITEPVWHADQLSRRCREEHAGT